MLKKILPIYIHVGKTYKVSAYAMHFNWKTLRIKIEKDGEIMKVIKKGVY